MDYETGHVQLKGVSHPENVFTFYNPVFEAIKAFARAPINEIVVDFALEYFNTSSARSLFMLFKEIKKLNGFGKHITINWHYEEDDEDMQETGEDFQELVDLQFNFVKIEST